MSRKALASDHEISIYLMKVFTLNASLYRYVGGANCNASDAKLVFFLRVNKCVKYVTEILGTFDTSFHELAS